MGYIRLIEIVIALIKDLKKNVWIIFNIIYKKKLNIITIYYISKDFPVLCFVDFLMQKIKRR